VREGKSLEVVNLVFQLLPSLSLRKRFNLQILSGETRIGEVLKGIVSMVESLTAYPLSLFICKLLKTEPP